MIEDNAFSKGYFGAYCNLNRSSLKSFAFSRMTDAIMFVPAIPRRDAFRPAQTSDRRVDQEPNHPYVTQRRLGKSRCHATTIAAKTAAAAAGGGRRNTPRCHTDREGGGGGGSTNHHPAAISDDHQSQVILRIDPTDPASRPADLSTHTVLHTHHIYSTHSASPKRRLAIINCEPGNSLKSRAAKRQTAARASMQNKEKSDI